MAPVLAARPSTGEADVEWYFVGGDGETQGPRTTAEMGALTAGGTLQPETLIWAEHLSEWTRLDALPAVEAPLHSQLSSSAAAAAAAVSGGGEAEPAALFTPQAAGARRASLAQFGGGAGGVGGAPGGAGGAGGADRRGGRRRSLPPALPLEVRLDVAARLAEAEGVAAARRLSLIHI